MDVDVGDEERIISSGETTKEANNELESNGTLLKVKGFNSIEVGYENTVGTNGKTPVIVTHEPVNERRNFDVQVLIPGKRKRKLEATKMTPSEVKRLQKVQQQEEKQRKREQERLLREKKRQQKEEEKQALKRKREQERQEREQARQRELERKRLERENRQHEKELQKKALEDQALAKERQQLKLNAFFKAGTTTKKAVNEKIRTTDEKVSDFRQDFKPFFVRDNVYMIKPQATLTTASLDGLLFGKHDEQNGTDVNIQKIFPPKPKTKSATAGSNELDNSTVRSLVQELQNPSSKFAPEVVLETLRRIPIKLIMFAEDVRPPYLGTFTRQPTQPNFARYPWWEDDSMNYDYDSEAEWIADDEEEDAEDLLSDEDEDDASDDIGDESDTAFVDDEDALQASVSVKATTTSRPLEVFIQKPTWDSSRFPQYTTHILVEKDGALATTLNPTYDYWSTKPKESVLTQSSLNTQTLQLSRQKPKSKFPEKDLPRFCTVVAGLQGNKVLVVEQLRQLFPHVTKQVISETLNLVAVRSGKSLSDGWIIKPDFASYVQA
ncbi:CAF assembly factor complex large subunit Pcf1 [Schizosaccharomyces japonicus yFS275]|uniref:CAF assembly factor complex large subunit Pcf1 n=1 Tax=Schizosaccharomyces japonicus (strain yFS275 / FY16936) TaxID=402676 RepID=B6K6E2_SCHJY|nr:CAF assembly factor complex large subunit Pcf1 [Schizosaccharomyces japonicus yFS275]EEB09096.1 CAF assembly factor complex large subunit Pcf1 [Schizosaccharomyces japonicus yFS275]